MLKKVFIFAAALWTFGCNFHEVDPGKLYRSAQLSPEELTTAIEKVGIKTIINLRGANPGADWFDQEQAIAKKYGVYHINIGMSASRLPHREDLIKLLDSYRDLPRPILIHCKAGADRTGEAAAIYQMIYMGKTRSQALKMLDVKYKHVEALFPAKDYFIREVWQSEDWARRVYNPCRQNYKYYDHNQSTCKGFPAQRITSQEDT